MFGRSDYFYSELADEANSTALQVLYPHKSTRSHFAPLFPTPNLSEDLFNF